MHLNPAHQSVKSCVRYLCRASARLQISSLSFALCWTVLNALFTRTAINLQKSAKSMSSPLKLATLQTSLKHVRRSAHNADFCRLSISKHPANAHKINIIRRWDSQWGSGSKVVGGGAYCQISLIWWCSVWGKDFLVMIKIWKNTVKFTRNPLTVRVLRDIISKRAKGAFNFFARNYTNSNRKAP